MSLSTLKTMSASGVTLTVMAACCLVSLPLSTAEGKHQLKHDIVDAKKVFASFDNVVAVFDVDKDGDLDCLTTVRTDYDKDASIATYNWILKSLNGHQTRNISFEVRPGFKPSQFLVREKDADGPYKIGTYDYTDYKNCVVMEMPYQGYDECVLWVSMKVIDNIPQNCQENYEDNCDDAKLVYDKESCSAIGQ